MATGVRQRHGLNCNRKGRCDCPWEASVYSKRDAKKIRKTFPTKAAAVTWRDDSRSAVRKGSMSAPTAITISEAADAWLARARAGTSLTRSGDPYKPSALRAYADALRLRVNPAIGSMRLSEVRAIDLKRLLVNPLIAEGRSASNVGVTLLPLRAIYREAIEEGVVVVNPTSGLKLPRVRSRRDRIATPAECAKLLAELSAADRRVWATAMYAGLRRGELMALHVEDVDLPGGVIRVCRGWDAEAGEIATKSGKDRKVPIAGALRSHLAEHVLALGWREGLLFGAAPAVPFCDRTLTERADRAWEGAGLNRITLHECRHTYASLMIAAGVNAKALSEYMGHSKIAVTMDLYGHLMPGNESEAAGLLDAYLAAQQDQTAMG
jgi:integrase